MSIRPNHQQFTMLATRTSIEIEVERLASLLAETERDLTRLLSVLDWLDGDNDNEPSLGAPIAADAWPGGYSQAAWGQGSSDDRENEDAEPSLGAPERHPTPQGRGRDFTCSQIPWAAGGDSEREV